MNQNPKNTKLEEDIARDFFKRVWPRTKIYQSMISELAKLIKDEKRKARIGELENLYLSCGESIKRGINPVDLAGEIDDRLAELRKGEK